VERSFRGREGRFLRAREKEMMSLSLIGEAERGVRRSREMEV